MKLDRAFFVHAGQPLQFSVVDRQVSVCPRCGGDTSPNDEGEGC